MADISKGWTIAPEDLVMQYEFQANIAKLFANIQFPLPPIFGKGIPFAFGMVFSVQDKTGAKVKMPDSFVQEADDYLSSSDVVEKFLNGIDEPNTQMGIKGYTNNLKALVERAENFRKQLKPHGHIMHKRAYIAERTFELQTTLANLLALYGKSFQDFMNLEQPQLLEFFANTSVFDTETELVIGRDKHWDKEIHRNDPTDIAFLSVAIPHCDIVVTEKFWRSLSRKCQLDKKYGTAIINDLTGLGEYLG